MNNDLIKAAVHEELERLGKNHPPKLIHIGVAFCDGTSKDYEVERFDPEDSSGGLFKFVCEDCTYFLPQNNVKELCVIRNNK